MNEQQDAARSAMEDRSRQLFHESVDGLDMNVRSRLTRARYAALEADKPAVGRAWLGRMGAWSPAAGAAAAVLLGFALWFGLPAGNHSGMMTEQPSLEDLDIVAAADEGSADAIEMLQNDLDFYDFAERAAGPEPAA